LPEAIATTSPLQYLHQIECLELLPKLFGRITVAGAVVSELKAGRHLGLNLPAPEELPCVDVREPIGPAGVLPAWDLGAGESASLSLAVERPGSWLILDDRLARQAAASLNVPLLGTVGVLLCAKPAGYLTAVGLALDRLTSLGFRLTSKTRHTMLRLAGEEA
jgi:predicted nucleic acid-binding protein